jgi:hypothetical protein
MVKRKFASLIVHYSLYNSNSEFTHRRQNLNLLLDAVGEILQEFHLAMSEHEFDVVRQI